VLKVSDVLGNDEQYTSSTALPDSLGDRYLCTNNALFRAVRDSALRADFEFYATADDLWLDYQTGSLYCLQRILERRRIPFSPNALLLKNILRDNEEYECVPKLLLQTIKRNYVFHESCHCIAHHLLQTAPLSGIWARLPAKDALVRKSLVAEAFANAMEWLALSYVDSPTHAFFLNFNSYVDFDSRKRADAQVLFHTFAPPTAMATATLAFLCVNLKWEALAFEEAAEIGQLLQGAFPAGEDAWVSALTRRVILNRDFVAATTPAFFRLLRCEEAFSNLKASYQQPGSLRSLGFVDCVEIIAANCFDILPPFTPEAESIRSRHDS